MRSHLTPTLALMVHSSMLADLGATKFLPDVTMLTRERRAPKPVPRTRVVVSGVGYKPFQGERECARRRGGRDWEAYKAADRVRRGLAAAKTEG
jgi:hypothetical protein